MLNSKRKCLLLCLLLIVVVAGGCNQKQSEELKLTPQEKLEDFNYLYEILENNYPFFQVQKRETGYDWLAQKDKFEKMIADTQNNLQFYGTLKKVVQKIGNGHTKVVNPQSYYHMKRIYSKMSQKKEYKDKLAPWVKVLNNDRSKDTYSYLEQLFDKYKNNQQSTSSKSSVPKSRLKFKIIEKNKVAYVKIPSFSQDNRKEDYDRLIKFWQKVKDYSQLIIDIRGNSGGSDFYWLKNIVQPLLTEQIKFTTYLAYKGGEYSQPFIKARGDKLHSTDKLPAGKKYPPEVRKEFKYFSKSEKPIKPKNSVKFKGDIYVLTDEKNYSSAETFCVFCKSTNWATLVGERTGGDGIGFDPIVVSLPNSGLIVRFTADMGLNPSGRANEEYHTTPDIKSQDPLEKVLELINQN